MKKKKVGRPRKFKSPDEMVPLIEKYFADCDLKEQPFTVPGLALSLGFCYRQGPWEYAKKYPEFSDTLKKLAFASRLNATFSWLLRVIPPAKFSIYAIILDGSNRIKLIIQMIRGQTP